MRLVPVPVVRYECASCGAHHEAFPVEPCCRERGETTGGVRLLTIEDVAELAQVARSTVQQWISRGLLVALKIDRVVRIHPDQYETFVAQRRSVRTSAEERRGGT